MSREVLGDAGPDAEPPVPMPRRRPGRSSVTTLDAPRAGAPATSAGSAQVASELDVDLDVDAGEPVREPAEPPPGPRSVSGDPAEAGKPPSGAAPVGAGGRWWRTPWAVVAGVAVGALVATVLTGGVMERQQEAARLAAVRLVADIEAPQGRYNRDRAEGLIDLDVVVYNAGQDAVEVVDAAFPGTEGSTIGVREDTAVPAGQTVRVPAQLQLDCGRPLPRALELTVRTQDDRTATVRPSSFAAAMYNGNDLDTVSWMCSAGGGQTQIDIWSTTARDDGSLSMQLRNPADRPVQIEFTGPTGTRIVSDPPSPVTVPARDSVFLSLTVAVDRCTSAAQRAAAADDLLLHVDGDVWGSLWADSPSVLAGWMARSVALHCR